MPMSKDFDNVVPHKKVNTLRNTLRKVRIAQAEQTDILVNLQEAQQVRLEIVLETLGDVVQEIPEQDSDHFILHITPGSVPRLWIDATAHIVMGRDQKTYRFLKDTRLGRVVLLETPESSSIVNMVIEYIAERIIERERSLEADWLVRRVVPAKKKGSQRTSFLTMRQKGERKSQQQSAPAHEQDASWQHPDITRTHMSFSSIFVSLLFFIIGITLGIFGLVVYAWLAAGL